MMENRVCYCVSHNSLNLKMYYGSTDDIEVRWREHINACNNPSSEKYNYQVYKYIREHGGIKNWKIDIIYEGEDYKNFESEIIEYTFDDNLNSVIPYRDEEHRKERKKAHCKKYREKNKEVIIKKKAEKITCEFCNSIVRRSDMARHKRSLKCLAAQQNN